MRLLPESAAVALLIQLTTLLRAMGPANAVKLRPLRARAPLPKPSVLLIKVLLVSDARQAMDQGAHLSLIFNDDRVEFDVNLLNLQKSSIKASSQMLKLARVVIR